MSAAAPRRRLFRRDVPRRAAVGAFVGFLYGLLLMLVGEPTMILAGAGWCILAVSLLFGRVASYYTYLVWAILWVAWQAVLLFRGEAGNPVFALVDIVIPLVSVGILSSSGYVEALQASDATS